jgi:GNAT superfamily N-acetyltransferase
MLEWKQAELRDGPELAELRVAAMKSSLEAIGRFDPVRARQRFLSSFSPEETVKIESHRKTVGFYVVRNRKDHLWLDHLYIEPSFQGKGAGVAVIDKIKDMASHENLPIRLCALRESPSNDFYISQKFVFQFEEEWDLHYEWIPEF